jgi:hypothetical protein
MYQHDTEPRRICQPRQKGDPGALANENRLFEFNTCVEERILVNVAERNFVLHHGVKYIRRLM